MSIAFDRLSFKESSTLLINALNKTGAFELVDEARVHDRFRAQGC
jgi:hypothetical protein